MEMEQSSSKTNSSEDEGIVVKKKTVKLQIVDSDDDSGDLVSNNVKKDSEREIDNEKCINSHKRRKYRVFIPKSDSDSEDETAADIFPEQFHQNQHRKDFTTLFKEKDLYDADGSGEEDNTFNDSEQYSKPKKSLGKHQKEEKLERKSKTKAMSVMQQIHSETQRLVRESPVSLPYHRPRQRTLAEFLQRRKPVPVLGASTRLGLNLPTEKLTEVWKQLEEREKEVEEFYKSESDESEKESDPKKLELSQDQPSGTADSGIHSPQSPVTSPVENQDPINETDVSIQKDNTAIESQYNSSVVHVNATVITENNNPLRENSELCKDGTQFDVFQNPALKTKAVAQGTIEDEIHKSVINSKNSEFGFNRSKMVEPKYMSSHNNLNSTESNRTQTNVNNITSLSPENSVTQFYFISSSTKKCENESAIIKGSDENNLKTAAECIAVYGKPDIESNEAKDLYFAYANKENMNSKYVNQKAIENKKVEREMNSNEISNVTASMGTQDLTLHWSETETIDTADVNPKFTNLNLGIQTESKEKAKFEEKECLFALNHISHSEITNTNLADVGQSSSNIIGCGTDTQNFHLHYSESQSSNLYKEESDETGKCVVLPEAEEENAMDISLSKKESSFIEEAKEMKDSKDTFEQKNTKDSVQHCSKNELNSNPNAFQQDEKSRTEWWYNIEPPSDDSDDEKPPTNQKLMDIAKNSFPGIGDITKIQPCLSDTPSGIIDLDEDVADKGGIVKFVQRFMKHSATNVKRKPPKRAAEISVVSAEKNAEGLETVHKDVVTILLGEEDPLEDPALAKPGAKLQRLKVELQQQMAQKRAEEWNKRQQEHKLDNEELDEDVLSDCGAKEEPEEEMTDEDTTASETEEEEEEEDDVPLIEKKRIKSAFVDDEAEESEDDEVHLGDDEDEEENASVNVGNEIG